MKYHNLKIVCNFFMQCLHNFTKILINLSIRKIVYYVFVQAYKNNDF